MRATKSALLETSIPLLQWVHDWRKWADTGPCSWRLYGDTVSDGQTHLHTDLIKQSEHQNATWHETQGLMPVLVRSNGLRAENQQLCRDPCVLFECMLTSVSAVVRVSGLDHCANNDWDFILHHLKREYYWRWYLLPCKISKLVHPNCVLAPPPLGCKRRMQGKKIKMEESKLFWYIGIFLITPVSLQSRAARYIVSASISRCAHPR